MRLGAHTRATRDLDGLKLPYCTKSIGVGKALRFPTHPFASGSLSRHEYYAPRRWPFSSKPDADRKGRRGTQRKPNDRGLGSRDRQSGSPNAMYRVWGPYPDWPSFSCGSGERRWIPRALSQGRVAFLPAHANATESHTWNARATTLCRRAGFANWLYSARRLFVATVWRVKRFLDFLVNYFRSWVWAYLQVEDGPTTGGLCPPAPEIFRFGPVAW
jgi:hypothetical protein